ncbi:MAG: DNA methyltransferase [Nitrososphaerota archaeon]
MAHGSQLVRYWGRKPVELARRFIEEFSSEGDVVLDTFGGSGVFIRTALELQRRAVYIDLNPFAVLIARSSIVGCDSEQLKKAAQQILSRDTVPIKVMDKIEYIPRVKIFSIRCLCGRAVEAKYLVFTRAYRANHKINPNIMGLRKEIYLFIANKGEITHEELLKHFVGRSTRSISYAVKWLVKNNFVNEDERPEEVYYRVPCKCGKLSRKLAREPWVIKGPIHPVYWYPKNKLYYREKVPFLKKRDSNSVDGFFLDRSLALLSAIWKDIQTLRVRRDVKCCLQLAFMATLARSSKMCRSYGGTWPVNSYWIPRKYVVKNPYAVFQSAIIQISNTLLRQRTITCGEVNDVIQGKADVSFVLADSTNLKLPAESFDYVIVDPPHTDEAQFFELSFFYTAWLRKKLDFENEIVINPNQQKDLDYYLLAIKKASEKIYHSLKRGRYYTIILHEEDQRILEACMKVILTAGFIIVRSDEIGDYRIYTFRKL